MIGIDLFAGAGGMSLGASAAGVKIKIAVELDKYAAETYKTKTNGVIYGPPRIARKILVVT